MTSYDVINLSLELLESFQSLWHRHLVYWVIIGTENWVIFGQNGVVLDRNWVILGPNRVIQGQKNTLYFLKGFRSWQKMRLLNLPTIFVSVQSFWFLVFVPLIKLVLVTFCDIFHIHLKIINKNIFHQLCRFWIFDPKKWILINGFLIRNSQF